jgi:transposase
MKRIGAEQFHGYSARKSPGAPRKLQTTHVETIKQFVLNKQFRSLRKLTQNWERHFQISKSLLAASGDA